MVLSADKNKLLFFVEEIEKQLDAKKDINDTIKSFYEDAKSDGFDTKALRKLIRLRKQDPKQRKEEEEVLSVYMNFLSMN